MEFIRDTAFLGLWPDLEFVYVFYIYLAVCILSDLIYQEAQSLFVYTCISSQSEELFSIGTARCRGPGRFVTSRSGSGVPRRAVAI
jgi:hypothetical protein